MRLALVFLAACSNSNPQTCPGAAATTALVEGYCPGSEADRCYYNPKPADGF